MKLIPINSSHKDPENGVFVNEVGNIFRKINSKVISLTEKSNRFVKPLKQVDGDLFQIEKTF